MFDLIVIRRHGGVAERQREPADIGVSGGKIAAIGGAGQPRRARRRRGSSTPPGRS